MKIRKILPLVILAVTAFFILSGCDAMLDAIFSKNQITVDATVSTISHSDYAAGAYVAVQIYDGVGNLVASDSKYWESWSNYYAHYYFTYRGLKDDTYQIYATYYPALGGSVNPNNYQPTQFPAMPYVNSADSTGHSLTVVANFY